MVSFSSLCSSSPSSSYSEPYDHLDSISYWFVLINYLVLALRVSERICLVVFPSWIASIVDDSGSRTVTNVAVSSTTCCYNLVFASSFYLIICSFSSNLVLSCSICFLNSIFSSSFNLISDSVRLTANSTFFFYQSSSAIFISKSA